MDAEGSYSGPERRDSPRYKVDFFARWKGGEWKAREGTITNLGAGGCFVLTKDLVAEGELIRMELELPGGDVLPLWGHVVYGLEKTGFAVRFSNFPQGGARQKLLELLERIAGGK